MIDEFVLEIGRDLTAKAKEEIVMLKGKIALITGSTSGIGLGIAEALAAKGCNIVLNGFGEMGWRNYMLPISKTKRRKFIIREINQCDLITLIAIYILNKVYPVGIR